jgi:hypothetical protein
MLTRQKRGYLNYPGTPDIKEIEQEMEEIWQKHRNSPKWGSDLGALNKMESCPDKGKEAWR